jgi:hypothetical protein
MLGASHAVLLGCTPPVVLTYDSVVFAFDPDVVSYWKFENDGADEKGTRQATITGSPELGVETIVDLDADGECIAWPGSSGVFAEAAHHAAHKTAAGTIVLTFQHDSLVQRSTERGHGRSFLGGADRWRASSLPATPERRRADSPGRAAGRRAAE